jgi:hypothetical protein
LCFLSIYYPVGNFPVVLKFELMQKRFSKIIRWVVITVFLPLGGLLAGLFSLPYSQLKTLGNSISRTGELRSLTESFYDSAHLPLVIMGVVMFCTAVFLWARKETSLRGLEWGINEIIQFGKRIKIDENILLADIKLAAPPRVDMWILGGISLAALLIRLVLIMRPMGHDEAYTFITFADLPFRYLVADYHFPNNHVLHTILVRLCYLIFGIQPWSIRLPALTAGLLCVPMTYFPARQLYGRYAGLLAAAMVASAQMMIDYSTLARGYSLVVLFSLLIFSLGIYTSRKKNLAAWGLITLFSALGFYTIPVMVTGIGVLFTWMGLSWLSSDIDQAYGRWGMVKYLLLCGVLSIGIGLVLYSPIFFHQGIDIFFANAYVAPVEWRDLPVSVFRQVEETWRDFFAGPPLWVSAAILILGSGFSLLLHSRISRRKIPFLVAMILFLAVQILAQRPQVASRSWVMLEPMLFIILSAGLLAPLQVLDLARPRRLSLAACGLGLLLALMLAGNAVRSGILYQDTAGDKGMGDVEKAALFLKGQLSGRDIVVVAAPDDAPFWYYFRLHEIPGYYIYGVKVRAFDRAFIPVNHVEVSKNDAMNVTKSIRERGPDFGFLNMNSDKVFQQIGQIDIHLIYPNKEALIKQYGK